MLQERILESRKQIIACEQEVGKAIIGQKESIRQVIIAILTGGNVLLEGVPGLGKTQLVKAVSKVFDLEFSRIQFTPDLMPADVTGTNLIIKEDNKNQFQFEKGPIFANFVLADEVNRATPKTQSALLEAMQEKTVTVGKHTYELPKPFIVLATQNPIENEGTYPLPEAQLDRFLFKLQVTFPSIEELEQIMEVTVTTNKPQLEMIAGKKELLELQEIVKEIPIAKAVQHYALRIVVATHPEVEEAAEVAKKYIANGASPRAAQAIFMAARAEAFLDGRYNVSFEDIRKVAYPSLRHRIIPNFEAVTEKITVDYIISEIIKEISLEENVLVK